MTPHELRRGSTSLRIPGWQEKLDSGRCGPASLKIVAKYYGIEKSESELADLCETDKLSGTTAAALCEGARELGFEAEVIDRASFKEIEVWLRRGVPVIVNWFSPGRPSRLNSSMPDGHYSVVSGLTPHSILLQDPEIGTQRRIKRSDFQRVWFDFRGETIDRPEDLLLRQMIVIRPHLDH